MKAISPLNQSNRTKFSRQKNVISKLGLCKQVKEVFGGGVKTSNTAGSKKLAKVTLCECHMTLNLFLFTAKQKVKGLLFQKN